MFMFLSWNQGDDANGRVVGVRANGTIVSRLFKGSSSSTATSGLSRLTVWRLWHTVLIV